MDKLTVSTVISSAILSTCFLSLFCNASSTKHFTNYPVVAGGNVTLFDADTQEVFYTTQTAHDGSFSLPKGIGGNINHEFVSISIKGGTAIVDEPPWLYRKDRHPDNKMAAMVRADSFSRGSITVSTPTTAAYVVAEILRGDVFDSDITNAHKDNLVQVTRSFKKQVSKWGYETVYLNPIEQKALVNAYPIDYQELVERVIVGTNGLKLVDLMTIDPKLQRKGLITYFGWLNGSSGNPTHEPFFTSKPLEITIHGEGQVRIIRTLLDENLIKTIIQDEVLQGEYVAGSKQPKVYKIPKIIVGKNETIRIEYISEEGYAPWVWFGCRSKGGTSCKVSEKSMEVGLYLTLAPTQY